MFHFNPYEFWTEETWAESPGKAMEEAQRNDCASFVISEEAAQRLARAINIGQAISIPLHYED